MCLYLCVRLYVCMYVYVCVRGYVCAVSICKSACVCVCVCVCACACVGACVCMPQTYIHKPNMHTQLVDLPYRKASQEALERVCMFKNPLPVMKKRSNIHEKHA